MIFSDCIEKISTVGKKIKQVEYLITGLLPVIDQGREFIGGYTNDANVRIVVDSPVIVFGDHTRIIKFVNFDFAPGADGIKVFKPLPFYDAKYFAYILQAIKLPDKGYSRHYQYLEKSEIPICPFSEQKRIVAKIESLFSRLDSAKDSLERVQQEIKRYRQSVLKSAFEGKLTEDWRKHKNKISEFQKVEFNVILEEVNKDDPVKKQEREFRYIDIAAIDNISHSLVGHKSFKGKDAPSRARQIVKKGDILFSTVRTYLKNIAFFNLDGSNWLASTGFTVLRLKDNCEPRFYYYYVLTDDFIKPLNSIQRGTSYPAVRDADVKSRRVPFVPRDEQIEIVQGIESRFDRVKVLEDTVEQGLEKIERLKQSILKKAFEGKLVESNPAGEPVEVLLERIKKEKAGFSKK